MKLKTTIEMPLHTHQNSQREEKTIPNLGEDVELTQRQSEYHKCKLVQLL